MEEQQFSDLPLDLQRIAARANLIGYNYVSNGWALKLSKSHAPYPLYEYSNIGCKDNLVYVTGIGRLMPDIIIVESVLMKHFVILRCIDKETSKSGDIRTYEKVFIPNKKSPILSRLLCKYIYACDMITDVVLLRGANNSYIVNSSGKSMKVGTNITSVSWGTVNGEPCFCVFANWNFNEPAYFVDKDLTNIRDAEVGDKYTSQSNKEQTVNHTISLGDYLQM